MKINFYNVKFDFTSYFLDSPPGSPTDGSGVNPLKMSRLTLWNLYNNISPPDMQKEALNLEKREDPLPPPPPKRHYPDGDDVNITGTHIKISSRGNFIYFL